MDVADGTVLLVEWECDTTKAFMVEVNDRSTQTLLPIIEK